MPRLPPGFSWQRQRFEPMHAVFGEMQTSNVLDRALCCRKIGACGERRLQSVHRLTCGHRGDSIPAELMRGAGRGSAPASRGPLRLGAQIDEVFPLICPRCGGEMRIIAFLTDAGAVCDILTPIGEPTSPPPLMPARAPPLWERQDATMGEDDPQLAYVCCCTSSTLLHPARMPIQSAIA
ncbi:MAG: hypothetical protein AW09_004404 [Candidatus Accumulibacter phosphatis]|uniref:Uncharacterized protein n=1 Tax=Candidatus Accumulibacter phosphatis TaxID=327160 RepID=A0A084Y701_9PROT|nr:MAG: hypothetical protein AW09_004404 [Candidatus Accumulibacter phosphatis]